MEQEHQDDEPRGGPATPSTPPTSAQPTPMTSTAPRAGNTHQAHSPQAPLAWFTAHTRSQRPNEARAITPALPTQPSPKGGRRQGRERHDANWKRNQTKPHHNVPTTAPAPQIRPQATQHASVPLAWTTRSIAKTRTTATCRGATPTISAAPATEAEGDHQTHTPPALHTRCTAHNGRTPTAAPGRPAQPGPRGKERPEDRGHSDGWTRNRTQTRHSTLTTATEPPTEPQTPHRVGVPRATTARSTALKTPTTAADLNTRRNTTATGTTPRGRNHKRSRW